MAGRSCSLCKLLAGSLAEAFKGACLGLAEMVAVLVAARLHKQAYTESWQISLIALTPNCT